MFSHLRLLSEINLFLLTEVRNSLFSSPLIPLVQLDPFPVMAWQSEHWQKRQSFIIFRDYWDHSPREQETRKTSSKEVLLQLAALVMSVLIRCWDGACSVKTGNGSPWSLTMSQLVESNSFQTHMAWPCFNKRLYIPSPLFAKLQFPASKHVMAKASHQNGFPAKHC